MKNWPGLCWMTPFLELGGIFRFGVVKIAGANMCSVVYSKDKFDTGGVNGNLFEHR
jgi:hypothetical protein